MDGSKLKKYALIGSGIATTGVLVFFAMAVAQRDSRAKDSVRGLSPSSYANKAVEGISLDPEESELAGSWPPPVVRGNDAEIGEEPDFSTSGLPVADGPLRTNAALVTYNDTPPSFPPMNGLRDGDANEPASLPDLPEPSFPASPSFAAGGIAHTDRDGDASQSSVELDGDDAPNFPALPSLSAIANALPSVLPVGGSSDAPSFGSEDRGPVADEPTGSMPPPPVASALPPIPSSSSFPGGNSLPPASPFTAPQSTASDTQRFGGTNGSSMNSAPPLPPVSGSSDGFGVAGQDRAAPPSSQFLAPQPAAPPSKPVAPSSMSAPSSGLTDAPAHRDTIPSSLSATPSQGAVSGASKGAMGGAALAHLAGPSMHLASATPGVRQLEGSQNPSLEIQKRAPGEVQVGLPATFTILVRNVGTGSAFDVAVHDAIPTGAKLVRTTPTAQVDGQGKLVWSIGEMAAGAEQVLTLDLIPETEGELGSVASVTFASQASVRTMSTQPKLQVKQTASSTVLGGETASIVIEVTNVGTGTARGVELEEDVPANMRHASGVSTLGLTIGDLAPGESEQVVIELTGVTAGQAINRVRAIATNNAMHESTTTIDVVQPMLVIDLEGPRLRYLERQATYRASITNAGTAIAHNIELLLYLPKGLEYTSAANEGTYLRDQHAVAWSLAELGSGGTVTTEVTLLPVQEGEFAVRMQCEADGVTAEPVDKKVQVEGQSELAFSIEDDNDPIETDGLTTYIVRISNNGTRIDSNVQLVFELPEGAQAEQVHAPTNHQISQKTILFSPIVRMEPKDQKIYRIAVRHTREGTMVARAQLKSDNRPVPVIKEESTHVYRDN